MTNSDIAVFLVNSLKVYIKHYKQYQINSTAQKQKQVCRDQLSDHSLTFVIVSELLHIST